VGYLTLLEALTSLGTPHPCYLLTKP
jgi:hypothetical protein